MKYFNRHILLNSIKMAVAAIISILIADLLGLEHEVSAGICALLTIQPTKKETIKTAFDRLLAFIISIAISFVCFSMLGYTVWAFLLYLVVYIIICENNSWYAAITINAVLMGHLYTAGNMELDTVLNEVYIFAIGVSIGILSNLHLKKNVDYMEELKIETDAQIQKILMRMSERILNHDMSDYNGDCFEVLRDHIRHAKNVAEKNYNNQFGFGDRYDQEYIHMRDEQEQVLYEMYNTIRDMDMSPITTEKISHFLQELSAMYREVEKAELLMDKLKKLHEEMKRAPLPTERQEFENRAYLFVLIKHMEELIQIKIDFAKRHFDI